MFYQAFVGLLLRERFLEGNDTHEIKPILAVSRNANVGTNRAEACVEHREGRREKGFTSQEGGEALGEACSPQDRRGRGRTGYCKEMKGPRGGCRAHQDCQHHHCHSLSLQELCSMGHLSPATQRESLHPSNRRIIKS